LLQAGFKKIPERIAKEKSPSSLSERVIFPQKRPTLTRFLAKIWEKHPTLARKTAPNWEVGLLSDRLLAIEIYTSNAVKTVHSFISNKPHCI
jgi:hypothetical protein